MPAWRDWLGAGVFLLALTVAGAGPRATQQLAYGEVLAAKLGGNEEVIAGG